jgi:hypothetical protein
VLLALLWVTLYPSQASAWLGFIQNNFNDDRAGWVARAAFFGAVLVVVNGLGDYVSLLETRTLLRILAARNGVAVVALILLVDVVLTTLVWISFLSTGLFVAFAIVFLANGLTIDLDSVLRTIREFLGSTMETYRLDSSANSSPDPNWPKDALGPPLSIYFYSTLFTSVWLWLFALSKIAVSVVGFVERVFRRSLKDMDVRRKPYLAMGAAWQKILHTVFLVLLPFYVWKVWPE